MKKVTKKASEKEKKEITVIHMPKVVAPVFAKYEVLTNVPLPDGHVRVQALKDFKGMEDELYVGDIFDVPNRRYKTMSFRGLVKKADPGAQPNKLR